MAAGTTDEYRTARANAAESLRKLGHALVGHRPPRGLLDRIAVFVDGILPDVESSPTRPGPLAFLEDPAVQSALADGDFTSVFDESGGLSHFEDSVVSGRANPMSIAATYDHTDSGVVARVRLGPAFEGAPGRAHGGIVAALFDETMGAVLPTLAYTGSLTINFRDAAPIGEQLEIRAHVAARDGRKIHIEATGSSSRGVFGDATGLFITIGDFD